MSLNPLESAVLNALLTGDHPVLDGLRRQLDCAQVSRRELTGVGFFADLDVPKDLAVSTESRRIVFGDVLASMSELQNGAGFLVYVEDGLLTMLEGYSFGEPWPDEASGFSLRYVEPDRKVVLAKLGAGT